MKRKALVILGMHRSGTSALAGAFARVGWDCGYSLLPKGEENPRGFYENIEILKINQELLSDNNRYWSDIHNNVVNKFDHDFSIKIESILKDEFVNPYKLLIKDPRFSHTLLPWKSCLQGLGYEMYCLIMIRHPFPVAQSLYKRNTLDYPHSYLLYSRYVLNALIVTNDLPRMVVSYNQLLNAKSDELSEISNYFKFKDELSIESREAVNLFLSNDLSHSNEAVEETEDDYLRFAMEVYRFSEALNKSKETKDHNYNKIVFFHERLNSLCKKYISERKLLENQDELTLPLEQKIEELEEVIAKRDDNLIKLSAENNRLRDNSEKFQLKTKTYKNAIKILKKKGLKGKKKSNLLKSRIVEQDQLLTQALLNQPHVAIIVISWNNKQFLKDCFDSIRTQDYINIESFLVDNDSEDMSVDFTKENYPEVRVIELTKNLGFAAGNNRAIELVLNEKKADYIFILNPDTTIEASCISELVLTATKYHTFGSFSPKMLMMEVPERLNSAGGDCLFKCGDNLAKAFFFLDTSDSESEINKIRDIFGPSGAATFIRTDLLRLVNGFEEELFTYYEDVELNLKVMLAGWRALYVPTARVHHYQGGTLDDSNEWKLYFLNRNKYIVLIRTLPFRLLVKYGKDIIISAMALVKHLVSVKKTKIALKLIGYFMYSIPYHLYKRVLLFRKLKPSRETVSYIDRLIMEHELYMSPEVRGNSFKDYNEYMSKRLGV